jgi:YD repeat-containing protein
MHRQRSPPVRDHRHQLSYDANGNLTYDGNWTYTYDIENRLVKAVSASATVNLTYDPLGRLFQTDKGNTGTTTKFVYLGDALLLECDGNNTLLNRYVHGGEHRRRRSTRVYAVSGFTAKNWLQADHLGSIVAVASSGGSTSVNSYDEYGIPGSSNSGRFQYTRQAWLPEIGMYYYKAESTPHARPVPADRSGGVRPRDQPLYLC